MKFTGSPFVDIKVGTSTKQAFLTTGTGTNSLNFSYTVEPGINDSDGIEIMGGIQLGAGGSLTDLANNSLANLTPPGSVSITDPLIEYSTYLPFPSIKIDNTPPSISGDVSSVNKTRTSLPNYFIPGDTMEFSVAFNEQMSIEGSPRIGFMVGNNLRYATYYEPDSTPTTKKFRYTVDSGNILLDLDGIQLNSSIDLNGGKITDLAGNPLNSLTIYSPQTTYVYFSSMTARFHASPGDYTSSSGALSVWNDITGQSRNLSQTTSTNRPTVSNTGFGTQDNGYVEFSADTFLVTSAPIEMKYAFFALKTIPSIPSGTQQYGLISLRQFDGYSGMDEIYSWFDVLSLNSLSSGAKQMTFDPATKYFINSNPFNTNFVSSFSTSTLWAQNTYYIMGFELQDLIELESGSKIGASQNNSFEGSIAEIIFVNESLSSAQVDLIRTQLNVIHGIY
jgi:hypothetical protein